MNPVLIGLLGMALSFAAGTWYGTGVGEDKEYAKRARESDIVEKVQDATNKSTAEAIAKIKVVNTTIRQELEREIKTDIRYVECRHTPSVFNYLNDSLLGRRPGSADIGKLPGADTPSR